MGDFHERNPKKDKATIYWLEEEGQSTLSVTCELQVTMNNNVLSIGEAFYKNYHYLKEKHLHQNS